MPSFIPKNKWEGHLECDCGFEGAERINNNIVQCVGCSTIYNFDGERITVVSNVPEFQSLDDLEKFLDSVRKKSYTPTKAPTGKKRKKSAASSKKDVFLEISFFVRERDNERAILKDARYESSVRGDSVVVQYHSHPYGATCKTTCKEV